MLAVLGTSFVVDVSLFSWKLTFHHFLVSSYDLMMYLIYLQQVPEEIERVMVGIEAYLSIRRLTSDTGLSFFENDNETGDKVWLLFSFYFMTSSFLSF